MKVTIEELREKKQNGEKIVMVTAYDCPTARLEDERGVDAVLVGDSVGTNVLGYASEREVTMADMLHHTAAAARGVRRALLLSDLPYGAADTADAAVHNARLLLENGAQVVKIEGWEDKCAIVEALTRERIPVCAHIGYNPQIHEGRPKVFGTTADEARVLVSAARSLVAAGAVLCILEMLPEEVAEVITRTVTVPTIGIGSGRACDGQVLVINDVLGGGDRRFRHARAFANQYESAGAALMAYAEAVRHGEFPAEENLHRLTAIEREKLRDALAGSQ